MITMASTTSAPAGAGSWLAATSAVASPLVPAPAASAGTEAGGELRTIQGGCQGSEAGDTHRDAQLTAGRV
jgi:hypothetical protein